MNRQSVVDVPVENKPSKRRQTVLMRLVEDKPNAIIGTNNRAVRIDDELGNKKTTNPLSSDPIGKPPLGLKLYAKSELKNEAEDLGGLPGALQLTEATTNKYFGNNGRENFFGRYQWLSQRKMISNPIENYVDFMNDEPPPNDALIPFAPVRPRERITFERNHPSGSRSVTSGFISRMRSSSLYGIDDSDDDMLETEDMTEAAKKPTMSRKERLESLKGHIDMLTRGLLHREKISSLRLSLPPASVHSSQVDLQENSMTTMSISSSSVMRGSRLSELRQMSMLNESQRPCLGSSLDDVDAGSVVEGSVEVGGGGSFLSQCSASVGEDDNKTTSSSVLLDQIADQIFCTTESPAIKSPRTAYLTACMKHNIQPRPSLILRKKLTKKFDISHQGMGNEMAVAVAEALKDLPYIQSINLKDNSLSDPGMAPLLRAIASMEGIVEIDLSQNLIGSESAVELNKYLSSAACSVRKLVLSRADVSGSARSIIAISSHLSASHHKKVFHIRLHSQLHTRSQ